MGWLNSAASGTLLLPTAGRAAAAGGGVEPGLPGHSLPQPHLAALPPRVLTWPEE